MDFGYYTNMETLYTGRVHGFVNAGSGAGAGAESVASLCAVLGSSVSLVALVFAFLTYSLFSDLRSLAGTAMINLLASLFMVQLLYVIGVGGVQEPELCVGLAFALHYMRLAVLGWLVAAAHHTHAAFTEPVSARKVKLRLSGRYACYSVLCWSGPLVALLGVAAMRRGPGGMLDTSHLVALNCWFVEAEAYAACFLAPAALCLGAASLLLLLAGRASRRLALLEQERGSLRRRQLLLRLFARVTALLALVVAAGAAARFGGSSTPWVVFNVAHGLQGVAVASCVTCNCRVLRLYSRSLRRSGRRRSLARSVSEQTLVSGPPPALV